MEASSYFSLVPDCKMLSLAEGGGAWTRWTTLERGTAGLGQLFSCHFTIARMRLILIAGIEMAVDRKIILERVKRRSPVVNTSVIKEARSLIGTNSLT